MPKDIYKTKSRKHMAQYIKAENNSVLGVSNIKTVLT